ncbi:DNA translocase FtsK [Thermoflexus sp.]|uniref:DNA translocase FtsK n=1 Tax=Thermoflexus sp. TaxID=1969742 RepID=UPI0017577E9A|nr:DNA translocase FtsK [Thermoflexus sp.]
MKRRWLEAQADLVEQVLWQHRSPGRVTGGRLTPTAIFFQIVPAPGVRWSRLKGLAEELALALGVPSVRIQREGPVVQLEIPRPDPQTVRFLPLMEQVRRSMSRYPPYTALLGLAADGAPLLIRLTSPQVAHILIAGTTGSGKTSLARTMLASLVLTHRPAQLALVLLDPKGTAFAAFRELPHVQAFVPGDPSEAAARLEAAVRWMERRAQEGISTPRVLIVIDELGDLVQQGGREVGELLTRLAQRGREAGIHLLACTQKPSAALLGGQLTANFPARLVGRVVSAEDARVAAGIGGTGAERLQGKGDFIAVVGGTVTRFQAAYLVPEELRAVLRQRTANERG